MISGELQIALTALVAIGFFLLGRHTKSNAKQIKALENNNTLLHKTHREKSALRDQELDDIKHQLDAESIEVTRLSELERELEEKLSASIERELAAAKIAVDELRSKDKLIKELQLQVKGLPYVLSNDARYRAIKKAPAKILNPLVKWLNDSIKDNQYAKWKNPPKRMTLRK